MFQMTCTSKSHTSFSSVFLSFFILGCLCGSPKAQTVPAAIYIFGDSLADVGNNNYLRGSLVKANFPHNGIDFPGGKPTGRFSNGKNAADFFAEKVGLPSPPPYLSLSKAKNGSNAFVGGINFASGGAGVLDGTDQVASQSLTLNKQVEYYSTVYTSLVQQMGAIETQKHLSKSIFAFVIGSNDLLGYFKDDSKGKSKYSPQQFLDLIISTLRDQLKRVYNLGARKIIFAGTGAIGCCPSQRLQNKTGSCNEETNHWSVKYNEGAKGILEGMKAELKEFAYSFFNTYIALQDLIEKPGANGFTNVKGACCGLGNLNAKVACIPISHYCSNRENHVFWDFYHPTEAASRKMTDKAFDGSQPYTYPINIRQLVAL